MDEGAPRDGSLAEALSAPLAAADEAVNDLHDRLNGLAPGLWWPLEPPSPSTPLDRRHDALYAAHAALGLGVAALLAPRAARGGVLAVGAAAAVAGWVVFTGAWNRRAAG